MTKYLRLTGAQIDVYRKLLDGAYICSRPRPGSRMTQKLYEGNAVAIRWLKDSEVKPVKGLLRYDKKKMGQVLDLRLIRALDGRTFFKKLYKKRRNEHRKKRIQ